jgi:hypothetical protein
MSLRGIVLGASFLFCASSAAAVLTQHNDTSRTGANLSETTLTVANVVSTRFGHIATLPVDGDVYAQPLYLPRVNTRNWGERDLVLVATANNTIYAFDANATNTPAPLWKRAYGNAVPMPSDDFANLEFTCQHYMADHGSHGFPSEEDRISFDNHVWYNMRQIGITGTPVVDPDTDTVYFATFTRDDRPTHAGPCMDFLSCTMQPTCSHPVYTYHYYLHAVDVTSGEERPRSPIEITGAVPGTSAGSVGGTVTFQASRQLQRAALLLGQKPQPALYIAFAGHGDVGYYHGWVFAYDPATLTKLGTFLDVPDADPRYTRKTTGAEDGGEQGGIWQSGQGPVADADGNVYVMSGNGSNTAHNFGDSFIKLRLTASGLTVVNSWSPTPNEAGDNDLGSGGPLLAENGNWLVGGGKFGEIYVLDRNLALQQQFRAVIPPPAGSSCDVTTYQRPCTSSYSRHIHGSPVYWKGQHRTFLYVWGENDCLRAYPLDANRVPLSSNQCLSGETIGAAASVSSDLAPQGGMPGGMLAVSANGDREGSAILWASRPLAGTALQHVPPAVLEAFDATNVGVKLWSSEEFTEDNVGKFARFTPPTISGSRVFMATFSRTVMVYGLLPTPRVASRAVVTALSRSSADASLYRVTAAGTVQSTWWDGNWHSWFQIGTRTGWVPAGAKVSVLSRNSSDASLYVVGNDGRVYSTYWLNGTWHDWFPTSASFVTVPGSPVRALSRNSSDASLYVVGNDGGVYSTYWSNGMWHDWFRIGSSFAVPTGSTVDAVSRSPSDASLYVVGNDGGVYSTYWSDGNWHDWFRIGSSFTVPKGSPVHVLSRNPSDASLYVVGNDGGVYSTYWLGGNWHDWFRIDSSFVAPSSAHVMPLSRNPSDASLYVAGDNGRIYSAYWANGNWTPWFRINSISVASGSVVTPLSRQQDDASLYVVGEDRVVHSTYWTGVWQPWFSIP